MITVFIFSFLICYYIDYFISIINKYLIIIQDSRFSYVAIFISLFSNILKYIKYYINILSYIFSNSLIYNKIKHKIEYVKNSQEYKISNLVSGLIMNQGQKIINKKMEMMTKKLKGIEVCEFEVRKNGNVYFFENDKYRLLINKNDYIEMTNDLKFYLKESSNDNLIEITQYPLNNYPCAFDMDGESIIVKLNDKIIKKYSRFENVDLTKLWYSVISKVF